MNIFARLLVIYSAVFIAKTFLILTLVEPPGVSRLLGNNLKYT